MIYEVNTKRIEQQLRYLEQCILVLERVDIQNAGSVEGFAAARALHIAIECMIDVGSVIIDGFIMRDPGGYLDIVDILEDEQVVDKYIADKMKEHVHFREKLVRYYDEVTVEELTHFSIDIEIFHRFIQSVETYLSKERAAGNIQ